MKRRAWTEQDESRLLELRPAGIHTEEIAKVLGRTDQGIRLKLNAMGFSSVNPRRGQGKPIPTSYAPVVEPNGETENGADSLDADEVPAGKKTPGEEPTQRRTEVERDISTARDALVRAEIKTTQQKYEELVRARSVEDRLVDLFSSRLEIFRPTPESIVRRPIDDREGGAEAAVLLLSDLHIGQVVSPEETGGRGDYNPLRYCERLAYLEREVLRVLESRTPTVDEFVVFLLGDIVHGTLDHGAEREQTLLAADQFQLATWTLHQLLARLRAAVPRMRIYTTCGNHGRLPSQRRVPTVGRFSNFDFLVYSALQQSLHVQLPESIEFCLDTAPRQLVDIKGSRFLASHGDQLRGGNQGLAVPMQAIAREVSIATQRHAAANERPVDYYVAGDKHKPVSLPLPGGAYLLNGSWSGPDEFSAYSFLPSLPVQLMFFVKPQHGKTWQYDIQLQFAPELEEIPYELPARIRQLVDRHRAADSLALCA